MHCSYTCSSARSDADSFVMDLICRLGLLLAENTRMVFLPAVACVECSGSASHGGVPLPDIPMRVASMLL